MKVSGETEADSDKKEKGSDEKTGYLRKRVKKMAKLLNTYNFSITENKTKMCGMMGGHDVHVVDSYGSKRIVL